MEMILTSCELPFLGSLHTSECIYFSKKYPSDKLCEYDF